MHTSALRPPLPSPLSHEGILFAMDRSISSSPISPELVAAIAFALDQALPPGDLLVGEDGVLHSRGASLQSPASSLWYQAGLLAGIERSSL